MLACGMYIGSRRELLWTLRDRAERAEAEQALRVEQGRLNERARIAREMHDVLAHRICLIAMHAGALAYRTDLTAERDARDGRADPGQVARGARATCGRCSACCATTTERRVRERRSRPSATCRPRARGRGGGNAGPVRRPGRRGRGDAGPGRPHGVPDRPGRAHQRPQARTRRTVVVQLAGSPAEGVEHPDPQPCPQPARDRRRDPHREPVSGSSASESAPSWPEAG